MDCVKDAVEIKDKKARRRSSFAAYRITAINDDKKVNETTVEEHSKDDQKNGASAANDQLEAAGVYYDQHLIRLRSESDHWENLLRESEEELEAANRVSEEPCRVEGMGDDMRDYYRQLLGEVPSYMAVLREGQDRANRASLQYEEIEVKMAALVKIHRRLETAVDRATEKFCLEHLSQPDTPRTLVSQKIKAVYTT